MRQVDSSAVSAMGYDPKRQVIRVTFRNGRTYDYAPHSRQAYNELVNAESIGHNVAAFARANIGCIISE